MATRTYQQKLRADAAKKTRQRILTAVAEQLRAAPTEQLSLDRVAEKAGVARSTIYTVFGSRAGLFDAFAIDLWARTGLEDLTKAVAVPDARTHLRGGLLAACHMLAAEIDVYRVLFAMARLDPDSVGGAVDRQERNRIGGMEHLAQRLADAGALRDDVSVAQATNLLWMLCSFEAFDLLHTGRKMSVEEAAKALADTAERAICT